MRTLARRLSITLGLLLAACGSSGTKNNLDASTTKTSIATASAGDLTVEILADTQLQTGMTPIYLKVATATGALVTDATVTFTPMMSMSNGMNHTCPAMGPPTLGTDGLYCLAVVFQMASSDVDVWSATVGVTRPGTAAVEASFPLLVVTDSGRAKTFTYTDPVTSATAKYVASLNFVSAPAVGLNPIVFTLHLRQDMMTFPSVDDAVLVLDPEMPSMGHGSPGSVAPTLTAPGRYEGQLSFSMAGDWQTTVTVTEGGIALGAPVFATTF